LLKKKKKHRKKKRSGRIKELLDDIKFCQECGEYIREDGTCSNPMCPTEIAGDDECQED